MHINMHPALPTPLPSTTLLYSQQTQGIVGKMAQDVRKVLWCHSHLVCLVFEGSIPTCTWFCDFFVTCFCCFFKNNVEMAIQRYICDCTCSYWLNHNTGIRIPPVLCCLWVCCLACHVLGVAKIEQRWLDQESHHTCDVHKQILNWHTHAFS